MALYKYPEYVQEANDTDFDIEYRPGDPTPHSVIYRCILAGKMFPEGEPVAYPESCTASAGSADSLEVERTFAGVSQVNTGFTSLPLRPWWATLVSGKTPFQPK